MKEINLANKKVSPIAWVPTLYFAMGMPFVVLNMVASLMYKGMGISDAQIAFWTSLITMPWTLKFLWSPIMELYKTKKFFVVLTQLTTGICFGLVALSLSLPSFFAISIALLAVIALSGATHDIAADGTYMGVLSKDEQARWMARGFLQHREDICHRTAGLPGRTVHPQGGRNYGLDHRDGHLRHHYDRDRHIPLRYPARG